jgi:hypothetical protein
MIKNPQFFAEYVLMYDFYWSLEKLGLAPEYTPVLIQKMRRLLEAR